MDRKGFSLLEVMVVVVIVGIIAAIAIPSYNGYVTRTRRADAVSALETVALYQEKNMAEHGAYGTLAQLNANVGLVNPNADPDRNYNITVILGAGNTSYVAIATGMNAQAGDIEFALDSNGNRGTNNAGSVSPNAQLWRTLRRD
ncbi:MAG: type IV pilin protein [Desulfomonilia bacterium]